MSKATSPSNGRRGRPTADRAQAIDFDIRVSALEIFLDVGFEAASMDAIAAKARVSKGTLYARYESKHRLFCAVITDELERLSEAAGANDHLAPAEIEPRLRNRAQTLIEIFNWPQFRALDLLIQSAIRSFPELERDWEKLAAGRYLRFLAGDIAEASDAEGLSPDECEFFAGLFLHSITGWHRSEASRCAVPAAAMSAFANRVIDMIVLAIRTR